MVVMDDEARKKRMSTSGFWGLLIEPGKMYSQEVPTSFKVTMASLGPDMSTENGSQESSNGRTTVMLRMEDQDDFAICSLTPGKLEQQPLDLVLTAGEKIGFRVSGPHPVHLTGYFVHDEVEEEDDFINDESEAEEVDGEYDSEDESQYDSEEAETTVKKIMDKKRKRSTRWVESDSEEEDEEDDGHIESDDDAVSESTGSHSDDIEEVNTSDLEELSEGDFEDFIDDEEEDDEDESEDDEIVPQGKRSNAPEQSFKKPESKKPKTEAQPEKKKTAVDSQPPKKDKQPTKVNASNEQQKKEQPPKEQVTPKTEKPVNNNDKQNTPNKNQAPQQPQQQQNSGKKALVKTLPSGLIIEDMVVGNGPKVVKDRRVGISYVGKLQSGKVFDKSQGKDLLYFNVGKGEVIKGMDMGIQGMCVGGKRKLTIPAPLAYGNQSTPGIPPNSTLVFELTVEKVGPAGK